MPGPSTRDRSAHHTSTQDTGHLDPALLQLFAAEPVPDGHAHADAAAFMHAMVRRLNQARRRRAITRTVAALLAATGLAAWLGRTGAATSVDMLATATATVAQALGPRSLGDVLALPTAWAGAVVLLLAAHSLARALDQGRG